MVCESCGNENAVGSNSCSKCGSPLNNNQNIVQPVVTENYNQNNNINNQNRNEEKPEPKNNNGIISIILGVACIILYFINAIYVFPVSIVGIILGKKAGKKGIIGLIMNIIALIVIIITLAVGVYLLVTGGYKMYGTYHCTDYYTTSVEDDIKDFKVENTPYYFKIDYDNRFIMSQEQNDTYIEGTFELTEEKYSEMYNTEYYTLKMTSDMRRVAGKEYKEPYTTEYVFAIFKNNENKTAAYVYNPKSMSQYICKKEF